MANSATIKKIWNDRPGKQSSVTAQEQALLRSVIASPFREPGYRPPEPPDPAERVACSMCGALFLDAEFLERHRHELHPPAAPVDPADGYWSDGRMKQWYCLYLNIKRDLAAGRWAPGEALPILALCAEHCVAQPALNRVLSRLADEQLVGYRGTGTRRLTVVLGPPSRLPRPRDPGLVTELAGKIRVEIQAGKYPAGTSLPKTTLARELGIGIPTLNRALVVLQAAGIIRLGSTGSVTAVEMGMSRRRAIVLQPADTSGA